MIEGREIRTLVSTLERHQYIKPIQLPGLKALERVLEKGESSAAQTQNCTDSVTRII